MAKAETPLSMFGGGRDSGKSRAKARTGLKPPLLAESLIDTIQSVSASLEKQKKARKKDETKNLTKKDTRSGQTRKTASSRKRKATNLSRSVSSPVSLISNQMTTVETLLGGSKSSAPLQNSTDSSKLTIGGTINPLELSVAASSSGKNKSAKRRKTGIAVTSPSEDTSASLDSGGTFADSPGQSKASGITTTKTPKPKTAMKKSNSSSVISPPPLANALRKVASAAMSDGM